MGPMHWIRGWELAYGIYPWVSTLVMGNLMVPSDVFAGRREFQTDLFMFYIIYCAVVFFTATCLQAIAKGVLDPQLPWTDTFAVRLRQPVDLVHELKTVKGLLLLVPSRTPRSSGYDSGPHLITMST